MTGYTVHTGSTENFASGWDEIFGNAKRAKTKARPATRSVAKRAPAKKGRKSVARKKK
jgi:hypothetical protein